LELVRNPFYLEKLCLVARLQESWPANRADLLRQCTDYLLFRERSKGHPDFPGVEPMRLALSGLAAALVPISESTFRPRADLLAKIPPRVETVTVRGPPPETVLRRASCHAA
jgi:hypothetical protein